MLGNREEEEEGHVVIVVSFFLLLFLVTGTLICFCDIARLSHTLEYVYSGYPEEARPGVGGGGKKQV